MDVSAFKSNLTGGGARPNQFRVNLAFPVAVPGVAGAARTGQFLCEATSLPTSTLGIAQAHYRGRRVPLAGDRTFQPWQITIINDINFTLKNAFDSWSHYINNVRDNTGVQDPALYSADMSVDHLDRNDNVIKTYNFIACFPSSVDGIQLSFGSNDELERFNVTLEYLNFDSPDLV
jgi:hypothetical protein